MGILITHAFIDSEFMAIRWKKVKMKQTALKVCNSIKLASQQNKN